MKRKVHRHKYLKIIPDERLKNKSKKNSRIKNEAQKEIKQYYREQNNENTIS